jgi:hypothetical protein
VCVWNAECLHRTGWHSAKARPVGVFFLLMVVSVLAPVGRHMSLVLIAGSGRAAHTTVCHWA